MLRSQQLHSGLAGLARLFVSVEDGAVQNDHTHLVGSNYGLSLLLQDNSGRDR